MLCAVCCASSAARCIAACGSSARTQRGGTMQQRAVGVRLGSVSADVACTVPVASCAAAIICTLHAADYIVAVARRMLHAARCCCQRSVTTSQDGRSEDQINHQLGRCLILQHALHYLPSPSQQRTTWRQSARQRVQRAPANARRRALALRERFVCAPVAH